MKKFTYVWMMMVVLIYLENPARAGKVRTLYTNDRVMQPVFLAMGRSTILRFDDKPKTAVVGNQNYFSLEFIGNDITIQPQGITSTNIFVYTENQTFGLILQVGSPAQYDDLVTVRWKAGQINNETGMKKKITLVDSIDIHEHMEIKGVLKFEILKVIHSVAQGVSILEIKIENLSKEKIKLSDIQITVTNPGLGHPYQKVITKKDVLLAHESDQGRVILRLEKLEGAQIVIAYQGKQQKLTLPKRLSRT